MFLNQHGFTTAAVGFLVFGLLMIVIMVDGRIGNTTNPQASPAITQESSSVPSGSSIVKASSKPSASVLSSPSSSASSSPSSSVDSQSNTAEKNTETTAEKTRYIKILSPNGGETYKVGTLMNIKWEYKDLKQCQIKYVMENGTESSLFIPVEADMQSFQLPLLASYLGSADSAKIKIDMSCTSETKAVAEDRSDGYFTITK